VLCTLWPAVCAVDRAYGQALATDPAAPIAPAAGGGRLLDEEPYDLIVLNDKERTIEKVLPLKLPGRRVPPAPQDDDKLRIRLWRAPEQEFEVRWGDIAEVRLFEQMLLEEARRVVAAGRFEDAFDYFTRLRSEPAPLDGLAEAEEAYFLAELRRDLEKNEPEKALAGCLRLHARISRLAELPGLIGQATEAIVRRRLHDGKPTAARLAVDQMAAKYPQHPIVVRLRKEINDGAADLIRRAEEAAAAGRSGEAQQTIAEVLQLAPDSQSARELFRRLVAEHPRIVVGVVGGPGPGAPRPDDWSAARLARLLRRPALDCVVGTGEVPSVRYVAGWAGWTLDDRDPELARLDTPATGPSAYDVAGRLSEGATASSPTFRPDWAGLEARLAVVSPTRLTLRLPRPHPRPEALVGRLLDDAMAAHDPPADLARYRRRADEGPTAESISYFRVGTSGESADPFEIVERRFDDEEAAAAALVDGSIDVVDRVAPWQTAKLRARPDMSLRRYGPALVHYLRLRPGRGPMERSSFRRALEYAIDREWILKNELHPMPDDRGVQTTGCVLPMGRAIDDPLGYGGSLGMRTRKYDPQQAFILARTAAEAPAAEAPAAEAAPAPEGAAKADAASPPLPPIVVSYPPSAVAERACRRLQNYWRHVGIEVELRRRSTDSPVDDDADIAYVVLHTCEPLIAAVDCFSDPRYVPADSATAYALRRVATAESFAAVRRALAELQQSAHEESLVIPLWQLNAYVAYRGRVTLGPTDFAPTTLYQFVDQWRVAPKVSVPLP
jgi:hypothetical protein